MNHRDTSAPERVASALRRELLSGVIPAGERIKEDAVSERFQVGRHTAGAALTILTERRLLVHVRNHGASVPALGPDLVNEIFDCRAALELSALRLALYRRSNLSAVTKAGEGLERLPPDAPWQTATEAHQLIHRSILHAANNARIIDAYSACEDEMQLLFVALKLDFSAGRLAQLHRTMLDTFAVGGDEAIAALDHDIQVNGRETLLARLATVI